MRKFLLIGTFCVWMVTGFFSAPLHAGGGILSRIVSPYADTSWSAVHADGRNSDAVPFRGAIEFSEAWSALEDHSIAYAATIGPNGLLYVTSAKGIGTSSLSALRKDGSIAWEAEPFYDYDDLDPSALGSSPVIDRDGDLYLSDSNQVWAYHGDGTVKWVSPLPREGQATLSLQFIRDALVAVTTGGIVVAYDRQTGKSLATPLELPVRQMDIATLIQSGELNQSGQVDFTVGSWGMEPLTLFGTLLIIRGSGRPISNTPAVHPNKSRLYIPALIEEGLRFYAIDFKRRNRRFDIAWSVDLVGDTTASSPILSRDGSVIYVVDGENKLLALNEQNGQILWESQMDSPTLTSPAIDYADNIYLELEEKIVSVNSKGKLLWEQTFPQWDTTKNNSVLSVASNVLYAVVMGDDDPYFIVLNRKTGELESEPLFLRASSEAFITPDRDGTVYITHLGWITNRPGDGGVTALRPLRW